MFKWWKIPNWIGWSQKTEIESDLSDDKSRSDSRFHVEFTNYTEETLSLASFLVKLLKHDENSLVVIFQNEQN